METALAQGFGTAIIIPAIASTLKQAQREAAADLHILSDYYHRSSDRSDKLGPASLTRTEKIAACRLGSVLVEQGINGTTFFLIVKLSVMTFGAFGGMLAQVGITGNTMITASQVQKFNPAQLLFEKIGRQPDWVAALPTELAARFAFGAGKIALMSGYGNSSHGKQHPVHTVLSFA
jgi:hypothetical protein